MSMNYKEIARELSTEEAAKYAKGVRIMSDIADSLQRLGELPEQFSKPEASVVSKADELQPAIEAVEIYPEIFPGEWQRQAQNLAKLFAKELNLTKEWYIATLPKLKLQPKEYEGRFDVPVIVETRVPLKRMLELAGIACGFGVDSIGDWREDQSKTPKKPYVAWLSSIVSYRRGSVEIVRKSLQADERGANIYDGLALFLQDPKLLGHPFHRYLDLPGSQVGISKCPYLRSRKPNLNDISIAYEYPSHCSVVAGRTIET